MARMVRNTKAHIRGCEVKAQEFIVESFDQPYAMTWEQGDSSYDALAKLDDGTNLSVNFNEEYDAEGRQYWHVEFWRNNSLDVTGEGDAQRVFATVLTAIQELDRKSTRLNSSH